MPWNFRLHTERHAEVPHRPCSMALVGLAEEASGARLKEIVTPGTGPGGLIATGPPCRARNGVKALQRPVMPPV